MKKNEHYFPTIEFLKDPSEKEGWRRVTYDEQGKVKAGGDLPEAAQEAAVGDVEMPDEGPMN